MGASGAAAAVRHPVPEPGSAKPALERRSVPGAVALLVGLAAVLRFATLGVQSLWLDESVTFGVIHGNLGHALSGVAASENTPPLYYVLAWLWREVLGDSEVAVRSLSALLGTATIPVVFLLGRRIAGARAGLAGAALATVNPLLLYYSQEARAYALLVLLGALSLLLLLRALDAQDGDGGGGRWLAGWALSAALALATHYFAIFLVAAEAVWLLRAASPRRPAVLACAGVALAGAALVPLALEQRSHGFADSIATGSLPSRVAQVAKQFLIGLDGPAERATALVAFVLVAYGVALLFLRADARVRRRVRPLALVGLAAVVLPLGVAILGVDYFNGRNVLAGWVPLALVAGAGFVVHRTGRAALAALCALSLGLFLVVLGDASYQRDDWRGAGRALGTASGRRAIAVAPPDGDSPLGYYRPHAANRRQGASGPVSELDVVLIAHREPGRAPAVAPFDLPPSALPGFAPAGEARGATWAVLRYRTGRPRSVELSELAGAARRPLAFLLEAPGAPARG